MYIKILYIWYYSVQFTYKSLNILVLWYLSDLLHPYKQSLMQWACFCPTHHPPHLWGQSLQCGRPHPLELSVI